MKTTIGDHVDNWIYVYGTFDRGTATLIRKLSPTCRSFVDVGCNIGFFSCLYHCFNSEGKVYAVDANPEMTRRTAENLEMNGCGHFKVFSRGVSDRPEMLELMVPRERHSTSSFAYNPSRRNPNEVKRIEVQVATLGDILSGEKLDSTLLKVDTEGFEYRVFSGLDGDLRLEFDYIIFEYSVESLKKAGVQPTELLELDMFSRYDLYAISEEGSLVEQRREDTRALAAMATGNYLLVHNDKAASLDSLGISVGTTDGPESEFRDHHDARISETTP
jgi:FkbM family methyltransferase